VTNRPPPESRTDPTRPDPARYATHRAAVRNGVTIAYVREGAGGTPLLLLHGYPETKRIWWRNIDALAAAGFDVIAHDIRGHGDSSLAPDDFYDIAAYSMDCYALVHDVLGFPQCATAGGDVGGVVLYDFGLRYPGFVTHQVLFNTVPPPLAAVYEAAGLPPDDVRERRATADYFVRQATEPDVLLAELDTPARRQAWVAPMYGHRLWGTPNAFTAEDVAFHTAPYVDADKLRASWGVYEQSAGNRAMEEVPKLFQQTPVPTLVLYGPADHVVLPSFPGKAAAACVDCTGPLFVPNAGHFLQWEAAETFNKITAAFCRG
jgi:pimeloyl-ACP methyl ester carboxylesterase